MDSYHNKMHEGDTHEYANILNDEMRQAVMPVTVIVGIEVFLGFFGNLLVLYVFIFRYHKCNFRYFVICLALTDITSSVTTMPGEMMTQLYWKVYPVPIICKIKSFFNIFTVSAEALCLLVIAVDRYRKVCAHAKWQISENIARMLCGILYIVAFAIAFPVAIFWGTHNETEVYNGVNVTVTVCEIDQDYVDSKQPLAYSISVETFLAIALTCMFVLYILIARTLIYKMRRSIPTRRPIDDKVRRKTLIMFILTVIFIITIIIYTTLLSLIANDILATLTDGEKAVYFFFFRLYFINHVINPLVYGLLDPAFRKKLLHCQQEDGAD